MHSQGVGAGVSMPASAIVMAMTRRWLRIYTSHAAPHVAEARRAAIESDIWEMQHDAEIGRDLRCAWIALGRLVNSIPDDLTWRFENAASEQQVVVRRVLAVSAATVVVLSLWALPSLFVNGRREVANCAATAPQLQTDADFAAGSHALRRRVFRVTTLISCQLSPRTFSTKVLLEGSAMKVRQGASRQNRPGTRVQLP